MHFIVDECLSKKVYHSLKGYFEPFFPHHSWHFTNGQPGGTGLTDTEIFEYMNTLEGDKILITQDRGRTDREMTDLLHKNPHIHCLTVKAHDGGFTPYDQIERIRRTLHNDLILKSRLRETWRQKAK